MMMAREVKAETGFSSKEKDSKNQDRDEGCEGSADNPGCFPHHVAVYQKYPWLATGPITQTKARGRTLSGHFKTADVIMVEQGYNTPHALSLLASRCWCLSSMRLVE